MSTDDEALRDTAQRDQFSAAIQDSGSGVAGAVAIYYKRLVEDGVPTELAETLTIKVQSYVWRRVLWGYPPSEGA